MLGTRIITALVLVPLVLAALFLLPPLYWALATLAIIGIGAAEWAKLAGFAGARAVLFTGITLLIGIALLTPFAGFARGWPPSIVALVCGVATAFWLVVVPFWLRGKWRAAASPVRAMVIGWLVLISAWVAIVELQAQSPWRVLAAMAIVWIADTAAYFSGRAFGRHKLAPEISPGKSWEGVAGGAAGVAIYIGVLLVTQGSRAGVPEDAITRIAWLLLALVVVGMSVMGDLFESLLKRQAGVKDSGKILPGHGGVLDRIDALLAAMPPLALAAMALSTAR